MSSNLNREDINAKIQKRQILLDAQGNEYSVNNKVQMDEICGKFEILKKFLLDENGQNATGECRPL